MINDKIEGMAIEIIKHIERSKVFSENEKKIILDIIGIYQVCLSNYEDGYLTNNDDEFKKLKIFLKKLENLLKKHKTSALNKRLTQDLLIPMQNLVNSIENNISHQSHDETPDVEGDRNWQIITSIYNQLRSEYDGDEDSRLPNTIEALLKLPSNEAYEQLTLALVNKIKRFYDEQTAGGGSLIAFSTGDASLLSNQKLFDVSIDGSDGLSTLEFFIKNFPWEKLLNNQYSKEGIFHFKQHIIELWRYRILHIQTRHNAGSTIHQIITENSYNEPLPKIIDYFAGRSAGGGEQGWDSVAFAKHEHMTDNFGLMMQDILKQTVEEGWLIEDLEKFIYREIFRRYQNSPFDLKYEKTAKDFTRQITERYTGSILELIFQMFSEKYGDSQAELKINKYRDLIILAARMAVWRLYSTLDFAIFDPKGIQSLMGRFMQPRRYYEKAGLGIADAGFIWRPSVSCIVNGIMPVEKVRRVNVEVGTDSFHYLSNYEDFFYDGFEKNDWYLQWLMDLKRKSVSGSEYFIADEGRQDLALVKKRIQILENLSCEDGLEKFTLETQIQRLKGELNDNLSKEVRGKKLEEIIKKQTLIDNFNEKENLEKMVDYIEYELDRLKQSYSSLDEDLIISRLALVYAVNKRYKVIQMNPDGMTLPQKHFLPIAIPINDFSIKDFKTALIQVSFRQLIEGHISDQNIVKFLVADPLGLLSASLIEQQRWHKFLKITDVNAILKQANIISEEKAEFRQPDARDIIDSIKRLFVGPAVLAIQKELWFFSMDTLLRKVVGVKVDEEDFQLADEEGERKGFGLAFLMKYPIGYFVGKIMTAANGNPEVLLEVFNALPDELRSIIHEIKNKPRETRGKAFRERTNTPVPDIIRKAVDDIHHKHMVKRATAEIKIFMFKLFIKAYLDEYAFSEELLNEYKSPIFLKQLTEEEIEKIETVSRAKPMNFVDRATFIVYVREYLKTFTRELGGDMPRNMLTDVEEWLLDEMKKRNMIGNSLQAVIDIHRAKTFMVRKKKK